uniref:Uncharacterized mitochondrial protein AtMg00810-like n=1 Tax=Nicotiana tabacum TaxID=4097 RepID=A0A1S4DDB1_TOBAC|nr:PREDICTED: uncharacterized mitochondrial protein AtMg00810-like [Nicotiana tabacum]
MKELLKRFDMDNAKTIDTPIATATRLDMDESGTLVDEKKYRGMIDSLIYLTSSKPDIVYNADYAGYLVDRKCTSGMTHFIGSCLISWASKKQNFVPLSIAKDEYVVVASCCAQLLWIK